MAGQLDTLLKSVAKQVVADLGSSLDSSIVYTKKASGSYNTATGVYSTSDTTYSIKAPVEFVQSTEDDGRERREAKVYITPDLIGDNQPDFQDEVTTKILSSINSELTLFEIDQTLSKRTKNLDAWQYYLKALNRYYKMNKSKRNSYIKVLWLQ